MSSFTLTVPELQEGGPVVDAFIGVSSLAGHAFRDRGIDVPRPIKVRAMIDTGASSSAVKTGIPGRLGLNPIGKRKLQTPSSTNLECAEFALTFSLPNDISVDVVAVEAPLEEQAIEALVGRDVLSEGVLVYVGYMGTFTFSV